MRIFVGIALITMFSSVVAAPGAEGTKAGQLEYNGGVVYSFSDSVAGLGGSTLDVSSRTGFQVGVDYFVSNQFSIGFDAAWVRPRYDAVLVPDDGSPEVEVSTRGTIFNGQFNGTYNLLQGPFTPYVEAGLGWTYFDSNVSDGSPVVGCWWDPWWGYICDNFYSSYHKTNFSYGAGAGLRWTLSRDLAVKAGYRVLEIEADNLSSKPQLESALLEISYRF